MPLKVNIYNKLWFPSCYYNTPFIIEDRKFVSYNDLSLITINSIEQFPQDIAGNPIIIKNELLDF